VRPRRTEELTLALEHRTAEHVLVPRRGRIPREEVGEELGALRVRRDGDEEWKVGTAVVKG